MSSCWVLVNLDTVPACVGDPGQASDILHCCKVLYFSHQRKWLAMWQRTCLTSQVKQEMRNSAQGSCGLQEPLNRSF
jgi:hypothetical protein